VVRELRVPSGTVVTSGQVLALIEEGAAAAAVPKPAGTAGTATAPKPAGAAGAGAAAKPAPAADGDGGKDAGKLSPSCGGWSRRTTSTVGDPASGRDGRLTKSDVVGFLGKQPVQAPPGSAGAAAPLPPPGTGGPCTHCKDPAAAGARAEQRVP